MATWSSSGDLFKPFVDSDRGPGAVFQVLAAVESAETGFDPQVDVASPAPERSPAEMRAALEAELRAEFDARFQKELAAEDEHLRAVVETMVAMRQQTLDAYASYAAKLALAAAGRVLRREIATDPDALLEPLRAALWKVADEQAVTLRVHPDDAQRLRANQGLLDELGIAGLEEDRRIERGGCVIEDGSRGIDVQVQTQLDTIAEAVDAALEIE